MTLKQQIKVMKAFSKGKQVEYYVKSLDEWHNISSPTWDWNDYKYRIKPSVDYGWRLPTIQELLTLVNYDKFNPACDLTDTITSSYYWSSTTDARYNNYAWTVCFNYGDTDYYSKASSLYVRCVKTKPDNTLEWSKSSTTKMTWKEAHKYAKILINDDIYKE